MKFLQGRHLTDVLPAQTDLPGQVIRIPITHNETSKTRVIMIQLKESGNVSKRWLSSGGEGGVYVTKTFDSAYVPWYCRWSCFLCIFCFRLQQLIEAFSFQVPQNLVCLTARVKWKMHTVKGM